MSYTITRTIALLLLQNVLLECILIPGSSIYNNFYRKFSINPSNSQIRSLKADYKAENLYSDTSNPTDTSMDYSGNQNENRIFSGTYSDSDNALNGISYTKNDFDEPSNKILNSYDYQNSVYPSREDEFKETLKIPEYEYDTAGNFIEKNEHITNAGTQEDTMDISRRNIDYKKDSEVWRRDLKHKMSTTNELVNIRLKRTALKRRTLNNNLFSSKKKRSENYRNHELQRRLTGRRAGTKSALDETLNAMQMSSDESVTLATITSPKTSHLFAEEFLVTTQTSSEESRSNAPKNKKKKKATDGRNDFEQNGLRKLKHITKHPQNQRLSGVTRKRSYTGQTHSPVSSHLNRAIDDESGSIFKHEYHNGFSTTHGKNMKNRENASSLRLSSKKRQEKPTLSKASPEKLQENQKMAGPFPETSLENRASSRPLSKKRHVFPSSLKLLLEKRQVNPTSPSSSPEYPLKNSTSSRTSQEKQSESLVTSRPFLIKQLEETQTTTSLPATTHGAVEKTSSKAVFSSTAKTTISSTTETNKNLTLKPLDSQQKKQIAKFSTDLKKVVWDYIDAQQGLDHIRKNEIFSKVLKKIPDLVMRHINEVISQ